MRVLSLITARTAACITPLKTYKHGVEGGGGGSDWGSGIGNAAAHALGGHWSVCEPGDWLGWSVVSVQRLILGLGIRMTTSPEWTIDTEQASHVDWVVGGRSLVIQWSSFDNGG